VVRKAKFVDTVRVFFSRSMSGEHAQSPVKQNWLEWLLFNERNTFLFKRKRQLQSSMFSGLSRHTRACRKNPRST